MIQFQNWYEATLTSPITSSSLNIPLTPVPPTITEGVLVLDYDNPSLREIIHFTSKDGVSVNCPSTGDTGTSGTGRGYEQTTARNHAQNAKVRMMLTAGVASSIQTGAATIANQNNNGGWVARAETPTYASNNGQREFTFTVPGDLTAVISQGMKLKMDRVVTPPTQAMSFTAASSQYATKASPTGITFTTAFTIEGWLYLNSYQSGSQMWLSKTDAPATSGFYTQVATSGQITVAYGSGTITAFQTYQSIPLKRWMHVAVVVSSVASKTATIYINGVSVPIVNTAANATTLTQAGSLAIGRWDLGAAQYYDGYIAEARIWSVAQTQSQIQANQFINLVGNEANLVFCARGNGDFTDRTVNANTLTATNGAGFVTMATTPGTSYFNATEQFIVNGKPSYTLPNTTFTVFGGTDFGLPSSGGLTNLYFSSQRAPFGFPAARGKWRLATLLIATNSVAIGSLSTWTSGGGQGGRIIVPTGDWTIGYEAYIEIDSSGGSLISGELIMASATPTIGDSILQSKVDASSTNSFMGANVSRSTDVTLPSAIAYDLWVAMNNVTGSASMLIAQTPQNGGTTKLYADCAYL